MLALIENAGRRPAHERHINYLPLARGPALGRRDRAARDLLRAKSLNPVAFRPTADRIFTPRRPATEWASRWILGLKAIKDLAKIVKTNREWRS
jgi:hypothetical protein